MAKDYSDLGLDPYLRAISQKKSESGTNMALLVDDMIHELNPNISRKVILDQMAFRNVGTTNFESYYGAGQLTGGGLPSGGGGRDVLSAIPFHSARGGIVDRIASRVEIGTPSAEFRMGIYDSTSQTNLYPNNLLVDAGTFGASTSGQRIGTINLKMEPNNLYWFVHLAGGTADAAYRLCGSTSTIGILGLSSDFAESFFGGFLSSTYGTLPATFPSGLTLVADELPLVAVRFSG